MELSRIHFLEFKNKYNRLLFSYHESYIESDEGLIKIKPRYPLKDLSLHRLARGFTGSY